MKKKCECRLGTLGYLTQWCYPVIQIQFYLLMCGGREELSVSWDGTAVGENGTAVGENGTHRSSVRHATALTSLPVLCW